MTQKRRIIYMGDEAWDALREMAQGRSLTMSEVLRQAVSEFLGGHTRDVPPNQLSDTADDDPGMLVPEPLGPDIRTTDEPVLPALKRIEGGTFHPTKPKTP